MVYPFLGLFTCCRVSSLELELEHSISKKKKKVKFKKISGATKPPNRGNSTGKGP